MTRASRDVAPIGGSALALRTAKLEPGMSCALGEPENDVLVYVAAGAGVLSVGEASAPIRARSAALVLAGEDALLQATAALELVVMSVGPGVDRHAPMGPRALTASLNDASAEQATGARSFQILFDAANGSTRATLFAGFVPPGKAPWHYHLYDEIVWVPYGPGRLHVGESVEELGPGAAFRLRPREVHIVENAGSEEMTIIGLFTPAGSPSAAYLEPDVAAGYRFAG
ncbi:MAG TPA: cupin domain-containing protein [Gaiellaceae bacterium]|nr:cupin domain-containing protein [Gaiellaceae bacterium]